MAKKSLWKKGRGKLGVFEPLLGTWVAESDSPMGRVKCTRSFQKILGGHYVELRANWKFGDRDYDELAVFAPGEDGAIEYWSFTSDGKRSQGKLADGSDVHEEALCFEAEMPAGLARQVYWPNEDGGVSWVVESKNKKGWNRFVTHNYHKA
ncbi:MAG: hypothetical protein U1F36_12915 [Planctomycetota bacterium]